MIFNLFKSKNKWQHKDSNIRIAAINDELSSESPEEKTILHSLLNEDTSELVRRAVLLKYNSFDHYLQASLNNDNKSVREFSTTQVQAILSGKHQIQLSKDKKLQLLSTLSNSSNETKIKTIDTAMLNHWLDCENEAALVLCLFKILVEKKNTAQFLLQVFSKKQSTEIQKHILSLELNELQDPTLLAKLNKKSVDDEVTQIIDNRLAQLIEEKEKPKKLLKKMQLLLSKLLALKDQPNYAHYLTNKTILVQEWQVCLPEFSCLSDEEQQTLFVKFDKIIKQLSQIFAPKEEAYHQEKIAEKLAQDKKLAQESFNKLITELNKKITTAVFDGDFLSNNTEGDLLNQKEFSSTLEALNDNINASVLNKTERDQFLRQSAQLAQRLTQLPEIAESVSEATHLISNISQLTLPKSLSELNDRYQIYSEWLTKYKNVNKKACGVLPQSIIDAYKQIIYTWQNGLKPLQQEQKKLFEQTKKKLIDLKRLLASGKYKVCFGLFKGVNQAVILLSSQQVHQLQRDLEFVTEKMAEISDWEHYIATPRKQELLVEINSLVTAPLDDPNAQAEKVKECRKIWNSLGHAEEDLDKELNKQFNIACEKAFAPCRLFYSEQEKIRALHLVTRKDILSQAKTLAHSIKTENIENSTVDFKALDGKLNKLQQRWQQAGEVDREQYQKLFKQFKNIIQPIKNSIKIFHDANGTKKEALIVQAEQQLIVEDNFQAIENVKKLQQQWRDVGFAGSHQESKLWQKFRAINDQVFAKRDQAKSEQQIQLAQLADEFNQTLADIKNSIDGIAEDRIGKPILNSAKEKAEELLHQIIANKPVIRSVANAVEIFIKQLNTQLERINAEQEKNSWESLFILLEKIADSDANISLDNIANTNEYKDLTSFWQKRLSEYTLLKTQDNKAVRADKTLELEILAQAESPSELASERMAAQVRLMQEQMQSSDTINLQQRLADWLLLGKLDTSALDLLARIKKIFII